MARIPTLKPTLATVSTRIAPVPEKRAADFYGSASWQAMRARVVQECGRTCERCRRTNTRIYVDHIVEIRDGGPALDRSNLQGLCGSCHAKKTAQKRAERR